MNTANDDIVFNLKGTVFEEDLLNYKKKSLSALYKLLKSQNIADYPTRKNNGYKSCDERPYVGNDTYNKIIIALRYDRTVDHVHPDTLDKKYHKFLLPLLWLPKSSIRIPLEEIMSDYCEVSYPTKWNRSDKQESYPTRRPVEIKLSYYIEKKLIEANEYYKTLMIDYDAEALIKERKKKKSYEIWECECGGYKGLYANSSRHLKTPLHKKRLEAVLKARELTE